MNIRKATEQDIPRLVQIEMSQPFSAQWSRQDWQQELKNVAAQVWCYEDEEIKGFVSLRAVAGVAEILNVAVAPADCRRGIGFALFTRVLEELKKQQVQDVTLEVNVRNYAAIALYTKAGLAERSRRKKFYHQTDDALLMGKIL